MTGKVTRSGRPAAKARALLLLLALSFLAAGIAEPLVGKPSSPYSPVAAAHAVVIAALCYAWCRADALARGTVPPGRSALLAGLVPPIGIPLYFFRSRPFVEALACSSAALLGFVGLSLLLALGLSIGESLAR